jgi:hypothetical protein
MARWVLFLWLLPSLIGGLLMFVVWLLLPGSSPLEHEEQANVVPASDDGCL